MCLFKKDKIDYTSIIELKYGLTLTSGLNISG